MQYIPSNRAALNKRAYSKISFHMASNKDNLVFFVNFLYQKVHVS